MCMRGCGVLQPRVRDCAYLRRCAFLDTHRCVRALERARERAHACVRMRTPRARMLHACMRACMWVQYICATLPGLGGNEEYSRAHVLEKVEACRTKDT